MTPKKEALFYENDCYSSVKCMLCPVGCTIGHGQSGYCKIRKNENGVLYAEHYGKITSIALDPIEKKPLYHFCPGSKILSIGGYSCNFRCPFCQNHAISMGSPGEECLTPEKAVELAAGLVSKGNIGIAYTYNEPFINYEYLYDTSILIREIGLKNVIITNGYINLEPLHYILPYVDAMNIDLKAFGDKFYGMVGGKLDSVKRIIKEAAQSCHVEVTTLIVPDENDDLIEMEEQAEWLASVSAEIPLHLSRFFPHYKMIDKKPTPVERLRELADIARKHLKYVYIGNV